MLDFLVPKKRWPVALDIGTDCIKMLQLQSVGGTMSVRASGQWQLPASAPRSGDSWRQLVVRAVKEMLQKGNFSGRRVISSLSSSDLLIKNVRLPLMSPSELEEAVRWEAKERFGRDFAPDQLHCIDAGQIRQGADNCQEIILLAAPGEVVDSHVAMLAEMGLVPEHLDPEPQAMFRPFERRLRRRADENEITVVVDLGYSSTKVIIGRGRGLILIKKIDIGGKDLAEAVARQLNLPIEEAAELRRQIIDEHAGAEGSSDGESAPGDPNSTSWTIVDAVRGKVEELGREVALCLRYCSVTFRGLRPKRVMLTGGQAYDPAVMKLLGEQLNIECQIAQPLRGIDTSAADLGGDRRGMLAEWNLCAGLAFRSAQYERTARKINHERDRLSA
jgi:type IV pilus assembly protein PilM